MQTVLLATGTAISISVRRQVLPVLAVLQPGFPDSTRPFFVEIEKTGIVGTNLDTVAGVAIGGALLAAGAHALQKNCFEKT